VVEESPKRQAKGSDPREFHVITTSANSLTSLHENKRRMLQLLGENGDINLANLAYTSTARRTHHVLRAAYCGKSIQDITEALTRDLDCESHELSNREKKTPVVFVFSGQGSLYAGMGKELFKTSGQFRGIIGDLEQMSDSLDFPPFTGLIADPNMNMESVSIVQLHLSLVALQIALTDIWEIWGLKPDIVMGHSMGEYAALYAAGVLSAFDVLYLVGKRAQLIQSSCVAGTHAMLSISGTANQVSLFLSKGDLKGCEVACFNSPESIVLTGVRPEILALESLLKERSFKCQLLEISYGMHSCQMDAILSDFGDISCGVRFGEPKIKILSTFFGHQVTEASSFGREYLVRHTREPVKFQQAVASCMSQQLADAASLWLEIGPNAAFLALIRANINIQSSNALISLRSGENNWKTISATLAALYNSNQPINWREYHKEFINSLSHIDLPQYAFDTKNFWITYKSNDQLLESNGSVTEEDPKLEPISTCLHHFLEGADDEDKQSASFTSTISHPHLAKIIEGHKLSGITICPAGVFIDMALTAARNLLTNGDFTYRHPSLSVCDLQIDHPVVPASDSIKTIQINITRLKHPGTEFSVSFSERSGSLSSTIARCAVRLRDQSTFDVQSQKLSSSIQPKIANLTSASEEGLADRISSKVFYKLFSHLMDYNDVYKGIVGAIVSDDFRQIIADVRLPVHDERRLGGRFTLSPYWMDMLGQSVGFLLNGDPDQTDDNVYIATHIKLIDFEARDFSPDLRYRIYAYIDHSEGSEYRGHAYILHNEIVVGLSEGLRFRKMPRKNLHHILGNVHPPGTRHESQSKSSATSMKLNDISAWPAARQKTTAPHKSNGDAVSLTTAFLKILLKETGLLKSELIPSAFFSEIGIDSMMSICILAGLKAETGIELGASFLTENPTIEGAQRALRMIENENSTLVDRNALMNGHKWEETPNFPRQSNVVLMSGRTDTPSLIPLFLIADGAGSAAAYVHLPKLAKGLKVFALESPWVHDPESFTCTFNEAAAFYLAAVRTKQAHGPYLLGGWSGGGVFAFEVARLLLQAGEKVKGLFIIDIPAPKHVDRTKVTMPTFEIINRIGMLAGIDRAVSNISPQSLQLKKHMLSTVKCFSMLDPTPMAPGYRPDATFVIWATDTFGPQASNLDAWFYPSEHDFGPNGWDLLVGDKVECFQVQGDHFSIMNPPRVSCHKFSFCFDCSGDGN
jgi:iterative type I PKS product template protein